MPNDLGQPVHKRGFVIQIEISNLKKHEKGGNNKLKCQLIFHI
jgi:hypothetical protein